jgi:glycosyltransferase involved in cell wall biosynthesis
MLKILHIAPQNYAGVPYDFYKMHNKCGDHSRLITLHKNPISFPEDICLNFNLPNSSAAKLWRRKKLDLITSQKADDVKYFQPGNIFEKLYFYFNDQYRKTKVEETIEKYKLNDFDVIHYDSGLDFYRNSAQAIKWKREGKKIVCCYYGSDLRVRGLIKELDEISDLNITSEYDHLSLKKDLHYLFYPYDISELPKRQESNNDELTIVHSPTNRKFKGTEIIISVVEKIKLENRINFILLENKPRLEVLAVKSKCDICIDQVGGVMGGTGYGKAGLETLAMGIPTITNMTKDYSDWLPENPFVIANNEKELYFKLKMLIEDRKLINQLGSNGIEWVRKYHGFQSVNNQLYKLYKEKKII